jgi:hypothetical protein
VRTLILTTTQDLLSRNASATEASLTLDEIAACAGISLAHLRAYYTSVYVITADLQKPSVFRPSAVPPRPAGN